MDEGLIQLIIDCAGVIGSLLIDPVFIVAAIFSAVAWMFGGQGQHQNPNPVRIAITVAGVVLPQAGYLALRYIRGDAPQGFEPTVAFIFSMLVGSIIVMFAVFGVMLAVAFVMTVMGSRSDK
jgi:hypothetical protein